MKSILIYILQMIIASCILYAYYHFFLRNKKFHRYNRFYLLGIVLLSIVIPFLNIPVYFTKETTDSSLLLQTLSVISTSDFNEPAHPLTINTNETMVNWFTGQNIIWILYILIALIAIFRIALSVRKIKIISVKYPSEKIGNINFVNTSEPGTPFSFFNWLFWNRNIELHSEKGEQIFRHELFHINQRHSFDIIFIEIVTALAWFNPFFHLIKKELKAIHEFLADEYAMHKNGSWKYAELLLMQVLNTRHNLVNPFFHNQIKRRIAMITSSSKPGHQYLRKLLVLPVAAIIAVLFAFSYKNKKAENDLIIKANESITIVVDAAHGGIDPGAKSPDGKYTEAPLTLEIAKAIQQLAGEHNIKVVMTRETDELPGGATTIADGLKNRLNISNKTKPDGFISVHVNTVGSSAQTRWSGFDAFITNKRDNTKDKTFASIVLKELSSVYKTNREIKKRDEGGLFVLDKNNHPSLILECGYINNENDLNFITDKSNQEKIARAILNSLSQFVNNQPSFISLEEKTNPLSDTPKFKPPVIKDTTLCLIVVDGKIYKHMPQGNIDKELNPDQVESITILKGKSAIDKYGKSGQWGVIEIITKKAGKPEPKTGQHKPTLSEVVVTTTDKLPKNEIVFTQVETPPSFPGGLLSWRKYLEKNLDASVPVKNGAKPGTYSVLVRFIVDTAGNIKSLEALTKHEHGMEEEVIRIISKGPRWNPASQNGHIVNAYHTQPVTFVITEDPSVITDAKETTPESSLPKISLKDLQRSTPEYLARVNLHQIISFRYTTDSKNGAIYESVNKGNQFNDAIKEFIRNAQPGNIITIDEIWLSLSGEKKKSPAQIYQVTN